MSTALFVPCYVDQLKPEVGLAALDVLEELGISVVFPKAQTCCGQPFWTAGEAKTAETLFHHYLDVFEDFDEIIALSGSCAATLRRHLPDRIKGSRATAVAERTREFSEFLVERGAETKSLGRFPHRVGLHSSCHALRELRLGTPSESRQEERADPARSLLASIEDLELVDLSRADECCGFGGIFSVEEDAVSSRMGLDRLDDHRLAGSQVIVSTDLSCLLQLDGLARRSGFDCRTMHIAELLAESLREPRTETSDPGSRSAENSRAIAENDALHEPR